MQLRKKVKKCDLSWIIFQHLLEIRITTGEVSRDKYIQFSAICVECAYAKKTEQYTIKGKFSVYKYLTKIGVL